MTEQNIEFTAPGAFGAASQLRETSTESFSEAPFDWTQQPDGVENTDFEVLDYTDDTLTTTQDPSLPALDTQQVENFDWYDSADPNSAHRKFGRHIIGAAKKTPGVKHVYKFLQTANETLDAFCVDAYVQYTNADSKREKAKTVGMVAATGFSQMADRLRLPEATTIPLAIEVAESHGKVEGAAALLIGVYAVQYAVGALWGAGMRKFRHATETFDSAYPGYKNYAAEGNAGYLKTLYRQSIVGLGIGNSAFMAGEVMHNPDITTEELLVAADRSSRRIGVTAGLLGYGALVAIEEWYDKSIGIPGVIDWTVPDVVENMKKASFWIIAGLSLDVGSRMLAKPIGKVAEVAGKVLGPPAKAIGKTGSKVFGPPVRFVGKTAKKMFSTAISKATSYINSRRRNDDE